MIVCLIIIYKTSFYFIFTCYRLSYNPVEIFIQKCQSIIYIDQVHFTTTEGN